MKNLYLIIIILILGGCESPQHIKNNKISFTMDIFYVDENDSLHIAFYKGYNETIRQYSHFDTKNKIWINEEEKDFRLDSDDVSFEKNIVRVKKDNQIVFTKSLPTAIDIENALNISLTPNYIKYTSYRDVLNLRWNRKSYIVSALDINKEDLYYIFMKDLNGSFSYQIYDTDRYYYSSSFDDGLSFYNFDDNQEYKLTNSYLKFSTNGKASLCWAYGQEGKYGIGYICHIEKDNKLIKKNIFDIYPIYKDTYINKSDSISSEDYLYRGNIRIFFDTQDNMHLFYNNPNDLTGKYFYYEMYSKDNPTTPKYEQKIY